MMELECSEQVAMSNRTPLKELHQNSQLGVGEGKSTVRHEGSRWRRKDRPENNTMIQDRENLEGVRKGCGTKREWQQAEEDEKICEDRGEGKRMKFQQLGSVCNYNEVEVASLDWPQTNQ